MATYHLQVPAKNLDYEGNELAGTRELRENEYIACPYCFEEASSGYDGIWMCLDCEQVIEVDAIIYDWERYDERWAPTNPTIVNGVQHTS
jgi:hypothetical protein